jgi:proline iminopeptidase
MRIVSLALLVLAALGARADAMSQQDLAGYTPQILKMQDAVMHYATFGSGEGTPLIVANGGPGFDHKIVASSSAWNLMAHSRRVVLYDQRGTGASTSTLAPEATTVQVLVQELDDLRAHLGAARIDLAGWSWGGYLAMAYAVEHPDRVAHLVLVGSGLPKIDDTIMLFDKAYPEIAARQKPNHTLAGKVGCESERIDDYLFMEFYDPDKRKAFMKAGPYAFSEQMCIAAMLDAMKVDLTNPVRALRIPTLVTSGRFDVNVAPLSSFNLSKLILGAQFHVFERSGHMPFIEQPEEFATVVSAFLEKRSGR